jgi:ribosomal protein L32
MSLIGLLLAHVINILIMYISECFKYNTCLTKIPKGLFSYEVITSYWKDNKAKDVPENLYLNKHRCPNCGATKLIENDCSYCGT